MKGQNGETKARQKPKRKGGKSSDINYNSARIVSRRLTLTHASFFPPVRGPIPFFRVNSSRHRVTLSRFATPANLSHSLSRIMLHSQLSFFPFSPPFLRPFCPFSTVKLDRQTEKYIYERNVRDSRRLHYHGTTLITFAAHVSYIYPNGKYAIRLSA